MAQQVKDPALSLLWFFFFFLQLWYSLIPGGNS